MGLKSLLSGGLTFLLLLSFLGVVSHARAGDLLGGDLPGDGKAGPPVADLTRVLEAEREAVEWIKRQMVPNEVVQIPDPGRRRLLLSYRVRGTDPAYPYVYGRSFIYDNALGAIALTMAREYREAEYLLNALKRLIREDGSLWFVYNTQNNWPSEEDHEGALIRMGSVAWVGYALTYYLRVRGRENGAFLEKDPLAREFRQAAESIARFLLANQVLDKADPRFGLVTGGWGSYALSFPGASSKPIEVYAGSKVQWVSMEHNIDIYFFLRDLGRLTVKKDYSVSAELIGKRLMGLWSEKDSQFIQGIHEDRALDTVLPLDGTSWGTMFLLSQGMDGRARECLMAMERRFRSQHTGIQGYRPYASKPVFEDERVNGYYFPDSPTKLWEDLPFVWGEGSLGAAAALISAGDREKGLGVVESLIALREGGGFKYASAVVPYQFTDYPSVASTAWFVIAVEMLRGSPMGASFWGK